MNASYWTAIVSAIGAVMSVLMTLILRALTRRDTLVQGVEESVKNLAVTVSSNAERLAKMEAVVGTQAPFFTALQSRVIDLLHHPEAESAEMDSLLEKLKSLTLSFVEQTRLEQLLTEMTTDQKVTSAQRQTAQALLILMPLVIDEAKVDPVASQAESIKPIVPGGNSISQGKNIALPSLDALVKTAEELKQLSEKATGRVSDMFPK